MIEEAPVFGRDHGRGDVAGQQIERHIFRRRATLGQHRSIARQNPNDGRALFVAHDEWMGKRHRVIDHQGPKPEPSRAKPKRWHKRCDPVFEG